MRKRPATIGLVLCPLLGILGWELGGFLGSFLPRSLLAAALVAAGWSLLNQGSKTAILSFLATGLASALGYALGALLLTPLLSFTVSALALGVVAGFVMARTRAKVAAMIATPVFATVGFVAGASIVIAPGLALDDGALFNRFLPAGAAGFGAFVVLGLAGVRRWLDADRSMNAVAS
jgi:hypothetical protein